MVKTDTGDNDVSRHGKEALPLKKWQGFSIQQRRLTD